MSAFQKKVQGVNLLLHQDSWSWPHPLTLFEQPLLLCSSICIFYGWVESFLWVFCAQPYIPWVMVPLTTYQLVALLPLTEWETGPLWLNVRVLAIVILYTFDPFLRTNFWG